MPENIVIIGSGPAAWTAAIYAARAQLTPTVIFSLVDGGGDLMKTTEIENFPGFPEGLQGPELMEKMQAQAERFGTTVVWGDVASLNLDGDVKTVTLEDGTVLETRALIIATGSAHRKLDVPGEDRLSGYGVSYCATCDGFFFKEKHVVVVGGGDSAMEEATFLTKFASRVTVLVRGTELKASKVMQERAFANEKIDFIWNAETVEVHGDEQMVGLTVLNRETGENFDLPAEGLFIAVGTDPRTHLVHGKLNLTEFGTIAVDGRTSKTSIPGVFAAGDVIDPVYRQAIIAAGSGSVAALDAEHYLASL